MIAAPPSVSLMPTLDSYFQLHQRNTTVGREFRGAIATFLTMAYILFVNPDILAKAGVPFDSAVACTALAAGICTIAMGVFANVPLALASGMGLNAIVAFQIAGPEANGGAGSWQAAMALVFFDGIVTAILVLVGLREAVMNAIPQALRIAIGAGIGLFIAFIGLVNARLVVVPPGTLFALSRDATATLPPVGPGTLQNPATAIAVGTMVVTAALMAWRVKGALVLGILAGTAAALFAGVTHLPTELNRPNFDAAFAMDIKGALKLSLLPMLFAIIMVDFFDTLGTATAVADQAGLIGRDGKIPRIRALLLVDSLAASVGGLLGASSVTSYIESAAGIAEGARTGLHNVFVGLMFLACIFLAPVAGVVPAAATAPALVLVGFLMISHIVRIDFDDLESAIPAFITLLMIPVTYSIAHGVGYGFISYVAIKVLRGKWREPSILMYAIAAAFAGQFIWLDR